MFTLRFDMRAPDFGAPAAELYAAAADMSAWAETHGCIAAVLCEHHGAEDGYLPSPIVLASAIAARTERLLLSLVVILPFYDPGTPRRGHRGARHHQRRSGVGTSSESVIGQRNSSTSAWTSAAAGDLPTRSSTCSASCCPVSGSCTTAGASR